MVLVQVSSSSEEALKFVSINNNTYTVYVDSTSTTPPTHSSEPLDLGIDIISFVRPHVLQSSRTDVWTANLDIDIWQDLWFETNDMSLTSVQGTITGTESLAFTAHKISIST